MSRKFNVVIALVSVLITAGYTFAQQQSAAQTVDQLKLQLLDLQAQQEVLKAHAVQLDEDLKPENIERSLAGIGSTRPEELRENRRRQLTSEKKIVLAQLQTLDQTKLRLESDIAAAEAQAYHESAQPPGTLQGFASSVPRVPLFLMMGSVAVVLLVGVVFLVYLKRRNRVV
ncbi:MAG TPA: hypothetical protein VLA93_03380 [Pyrinomonadaceae bacterium]|nr:hypothetical protein [Pyrinomonadaceae bacterium]